MILKGFLQRVTVNAGVSGAAPSSFTTILLADGLPSSIPVNMREATEMGVGIYEFSFLVPIDDPHYHYHIRITSSTYYIDSGFEFYPQELRCGRPVTITIQAGYVGVSDWVTYLARDGVLINVPVTIAEIPSLGYGMYQVTFTPEWDTVAHHYELRVTSVMATVDSGMGFDIPPGRLLDKPGRYPIIHGTVELVGIKVGYQLREGAILKRKYDIDFIASLDESHDPDTQFVTFPYVSKRFVIYDNDGVRYVGDVVLAGNDQISPPNSKYALTVYLDGTVLYYKQFTVSSSEVQYPPIISHLNQQGVMYDV